MIMKTINLIEQIRKDKKTVTINYKIDENKYISKRLSVYKIICMIERNGYLPFESCVCPLVVEELGTYRVNYDFLNRKYRKRQTEKHLSNCYLSKNIFDEIRDYVNELLK